MADSESKIAVWIPLTVSFIADVVTILAFLGVVATRSIRLAVGTSLSVVGPAVGGLILLRAVRLWRSPEGEHYLRSYHQRRIGSATAALLMASALAVFVVELAASNHATKARPVKAAPSAAGGHQKT
jgi:hypothetical protein